MSGSGTLVIQSWKALLLHNETDVRKLYTNSNFKKNSIIHIHVMSLIGWKWRKKKTTNKRHEYSAITFLPHILAITLQGMEISRAQ